MPSIHVSEDPAAQTVTISIRERFDFGVHKEFRASYRDRAGPIRYIIDMREVIYIDSSALGMMLLLREHAQASKGTVVLESCTPDVKKILTIANFESLFEIN